MFIHALEKMSIWTHIQRWWKERIRHGGNLFAVINGKKMKNRALIPEGKIKVLPSTHLKNETFERRRSKKRLVTVKWKEISTISTLTTETWKWTPLKSPVDSMWALTVLVSWNQKSKENSCPNLFRCGFVRFRTNFSKLSSPNFCFLTPVNWY